MSTKQRGSGWSIRLVFNLYKTLGYTFIYYLMYPVTFFYFLVAHNVKEALKEYYAHIGEPFTLWGYYEHLRHFAITMCDRFISKVEPQSYTFIMDNPELLLSNVQQGSILLLSHFGGWAAAGNCFSGFKMNVIMQEALLEEIKAIEESLETKNSNLNIIDLSKGASSVSLEIASALLRNESVAMMADRATEPKHAKELLFFGKPALFNQNPFAIAYKTQKPLIALVVIYEKARTYRIECINLSMNKTHHKNEEIETSMQHYADFLADVVKRYPKQWFNFYHFWKEKRT
ncbi:MAG: lysophospholipid acyltransferase family protein [Campylobacterales bacterium]|nr:lysophospholipid acyltransferase family protein [Campylobacterales bacterium]MBN2833083.1 lysophospholipid acyltransferase family protein [Campylobacterales bacterium]